MENLEINPTTHQLMKELKFTRIICMISSVLTLCLLAGGILLSGRVQELAGICGPVVEKVSELDVESLNDTLNHINASMEAVEWEQVAEALETVDWKQVSDSLGELDVKAINSAIEGLDTEELSESLKNLNDAVDKVREISEKLNDLTSWAGGIFH